HDLLDSSRSRRDCGHHEADTTGRGSIECSGKDYIYFSKHWTVYVLNPLIITISANMDVPQAQVRALPEFSELANKLFREVPREFFSVLASQNAPLYLDALDSLERGLSAGGSLTRAEAADVIAEVLRKHPEFALNEE